MSTRALRFGSRSESSSSGRIGRGGLWRKPLAVRYESPAMPSSGPPLSSARSSSEKVSSPSPDTTKSMPGFSPVQAAVARLGS